MTTEETIPSEANGVQRRKLLKVAAWSAPVVAVAVASPLATASVGNASVAFTASATDLLSVRLLDDGSLVTALALVTLPTEYTITNGPGAIDQVATVTVVVGVPSGVTLSFGQGRGFGVYSLDGTVVSTQNTVDYGTSPSGFPVTTFIGSTPVSIASDGSLAVPIEFGLSGVSTGAALGLLASFPVTLTVDFGGGNSYNASSTISVPVTAGIL